MLDYIGMMVVSPRKSIQILVAEKRSILLGLAIVILASLVGGLNLAYIVSIKGLGFVGLKLPFLVSLSSVGIVGGYIILNIVLWLVLGVLIYAFDKLLGGKASLETVLLAYSYQWLPVLITGLFSPVFYYLDTLTSIVVYVLLLLIALVWGYVYTLITNAEVNKFSLGQSFASVLIAYIIIVITALPVSMVGGVH